jgi:hypothetical protein
MVVAISTTTGPIKVRQEEPRNKNVASRADAYERLDM